MTFLKSDLLILASLFFAWTVPIQWWTDRYWPKFSFGLMLVIGSLFAGMPAFIALEIRYKDATLSDDVPMLVYFMLTALLWFPVLVMSCLRMLRLHEKTLRLLEEAAASDSDEPTSVPAPPRVAHPTVERLP